MVSSRPRANGPASEFLRAGLYLNEEREAALLALREAIDAGGLSGPAAPFCFDAFVAEKRSSAIP